MTWREDAAARLTIAIGEEREKVTRTLTAYQQAVGRLEDASRLQATLTQRVLDATTDEEIDRYTRLVGRNMRRMRRKYGKAAILSFQIEREVTRLREHLHLRAQIIEEGEGWNLKSRLQWLKKP